MSVDVVTARGTAPTDQESTCRVLVIDRSPAFAEALARSLINAGLPTCHQDLDSPADAGEASVVLIDGDQPAHVVSAVTNRLREQSPAARFVLLVRRAHPLHRRLATQVGAAACVTRQIGLRELVDLVRDTHALRQPHMASRNQRLGADEQVIESLTARECEVLRLIAVGLRNEGIATSLAISPNTVRTHVQNIIGKLGTNNRVTAAGIARRAGLIDVESTTVAGADS